MHPCSKRSSTSVERRQDGCKKRVFRGATRVAKNANAENTTPMPWFGVIGLEGKGGGGKDDDEGRRWRENEPEGLMRRETGTEGKGLVRAPDCRGGGGREEGVRGEMAPPPIVEAASASVDVASGGGEHKIPRTCLVHSLRRMCSCSIHSVLHKHTKSRCNAATLIRVSRFT